MRNSLATQSADSKPTAHTTSPMPRLYPEPCPPKIRFVSDAVFGNNDLELKNLVRTNPTLDTVAVLSMPTLLPQWQAHANSRKTPITKAHLAFKTIYLNEGKSQVSFSFENTWQKYAMGLLMPVGSAWRLPGLGYQLINVGRAN